jgi:hypothetical protein
MSFIKVNIVLGISAIIFFGCDSSNQNNKAVLVSDSKESMKDRPDVMKSDSVLRTGWYFISDSSTGFKRQLDKTTEIYDVDPTPIISVSDFNQVEIFHEKDCYALIITVDRNGAEALKIAKQKSAGKKIGFVIDNKLLRIQAIDDPQFAQVENGADSRIY